MNDERKIDIRIKEIILDKIKEQEEFSKSVIEDAMKKIQNDGADLGLLSEAAIQSRISSNAAAELRWALEVFETGEVPPIFF